MEVATLRCLDGAWSSPFPALDSSQTIVVAFAAPSYRDRPGVLAELCEAFPNSVVIGCSTSGEIDQARIRDESISVAVVRFARARVRLARAALGSAAGSFTAGGAIGDALRGDEL